MRSTVDEAAAIFNHCVNRRRFESLCWGRRVFDSGRRIGRLRGLRDADRQALRLSGLSHFVAVSGSNVALFLPAWSPTLGVRDAYQRLLTTVPRPPMSSKSTIVLRNDEISLLL